MAMLLRFLMECLRIILRCTRPLSDKILDVLYMMCMGCHQKLPPIKDKILLMPATILAQRIRQRELKAEEVMKAYIKRIEEVEPLINAYNDERFDDALAEAQDVDNYLEETDDLEEDIAAERPLLGVPFTCKESIGVEGLAQTLGMMSKRDDKAPADGETVILLRKAGAIPVTVTNVPLWLMWWGSANHVSGMTKNPYNHIRTVGGSSGGEGAIISSAGAMIGIGTDIAGSIRIPSSFCGIYGHKPSTGIISNHSSRPGDDPRSLTNLFSTGPMCRYVQDLKLLTEILAGDTATKLQLKKEVDFSKVKIYYMEEFPGFLLKSTSDIKAAIQKAVKYFEDEFGNKATKLMFEELRDGFAIWESKLLEVGKPPFRSLLSEGKPINLFVEFLKSLIGRSHYTWPALYFAAVDRRCKDKAHYECLAKFESLKRKFDKIFKEDAILLVPTHPEPPPHYLLTIPKYPNIVYTCIFNALGYPSSQVPVGFSSGVPIGIQVVSTTFQDHLTIAAAEELDKEFGGWVSPSPIEVYELS